MTNRTINWKRVWIKFDEWLDKSEVSELEWCRQYKKIQQLVNKQLKEQQGRFIEMTLPR